MSNVAIQKDVGVGDNPLIPKIIAFNAKIKHEGYSFVDVTCFCGVDDSFEVIKYDRYGIFYPLHLCRHCGLMFAKKRMTEASNQEYYETEYRDIYDFGWVKKDFDRVVDFQYDTFTEILDGIDINPEVIFEVGCNEGGFLQKLQDKHEVYGVDFDETNIRKGRKSGLNIECGGIDKLMDVGKKADMIVLNHVLEHCGDIEKELAKLPKLLKQDGYVYISVPTFYGQDFNTLFQSAHNWQFTLNTLEYVMECCGYESIHSDVGINSVWHYTGDKRDKNNVRRNEAKEIWGFAFSGKNLLHTLNTGCKFDLKDRKANVVKSLSYKLPDIRELKDAEAGQEAVVIAGGPSIKEYIPKIKKLISEGKKVVSIDRMYKWCLDNGIKPDYVVVIDGSDDVVDSFKEINKDTVHIMGSICQESICELLKDYKTFIYSSQQAGITLGDEWDKNEYEKITLLNTGGSVTLASFVISTYLGMRDIHMFGFDCHVMGGNYVKGIAGLGDVKDNLTISIDEKDWVTTGPFVAFAQQFFQIYILVKCNKMLDSVKIYGDSLVKAMSKIDIDGDKEGL